MSSVRILGLDGGFACMGYGVIELSQASEKILDLGVIQTEKSDKKRAVRASDDNLRRARELAEHLELLMARYDIRAVACESMSFPRSASVAQKLGIAWGVVATVVHLRRLPVVQASPQEVKKKLCGKRDASKEDVQHALALRFEDAFVERTRVMNKGVREHPADALAAVVACLDSDVIRAMRIPRDQEHAPCREPSSETGRDDMRIGADH